jgi:hypothetical protein
MRVKGQAIGIRGTLLWVDPITGSFAARFDVPLTAPAPGEHIQDINFKAETPTTVIDLVWGLMWEIIS